MKNNLHVFLGATVADAAARPLHWVYNQKKLNSYIKGKKDFTFLKKNKSPFYNIKTGKVSGYNEIGQVMFQTLLENYEDIDKEFKKNILKNFGPGSEYWKNLNLRSKYKKVVRIFFYSAIPYTTKFFINIYTIFHFSFTNLEFWWSKS